jgi:glycine/D-amino acid oxidase-like deaminating enzyme
MYMNDEDLAAAASTEWDVIVVGAGAVGLILSVSLARANKRVLLLESGAAEHGDAKDLNEILVTGRPSSRRYARESKDGWRNDHALGRSTHPIHTL